MHKIGQPVGFLARCLGPLTKTVLLLMKSVLTPLAKSILIPLVLSVGMPEQMQPCKIKLMDQAQQYY